MSFRGLLIKLANYLSIETRAAFVKMPVLATLSPGFTPDRISPCPAFRSASAR
jgi:hypothetical protein